MDNWQIFQVILSVVSIVLLFILVLDTLGIIPRPEGMTGAIVKGTPTHWRREMGNSDVYRVLAGGK